MAKSNVKTNVWYRKSRNTICQTNVPKKLSASKNAGNPKSARTKESRFVKAMLSRRTKINVDVLNLFVDLKKDFATSSRQHVTQDNAHLNARKSHNVAQISHTHHASAIPALEIFVALEMDAQMSSIVNATKPTKTTSKTVALEIRMDASHSGESASLPLPTTEP